MPPEERRRALIEATIPLLAEHGANVSTRQVAEAAGVAEGTIFRVFESKGDLLHAAATAAITEDGLTEALAEVPDGADLRTAVVEIARLLARRVSRMRAMVMLFHHGHESHAGAAHPLAALPGDDLDGAGPARCARPDPRAVHEHVSAQVTRALEPYAADLTVEPQLAASALISLTFGALHPVAGHPALSDPDAIATLLLDGIATKEAA